MITENRDNAGAARTVLELDVRNHPSVMSHVWGLLTRRAYHVEGVVCLPTTDRRFSRIWLLLNEEQRLGQVIQQLLKLHDVLNIQRHRAAHSGFARLDRLFHPPMSDTDRPRHE